MYLSRKPCLSLKGIWLSGCGGKDIQQVEDIYPWETLACFIHYQAGWYRIWGKISFRQEMVHNTCHWLATHRCITSLYRLWNTIKLRELLPVAVQEDGTVILARGVPANTNRPVINSNCPDKRGIDWPSQSHHATPRSAITFILFSIIRALLIQDATVYH